MTNTGTNIGAFSFSDIVSKRQNVFESYDFPVDISDTEIIFRFAYILN